MTLKNSAGLSVTVLDNGSVSKIDAGKIRISLRVASPFSGAAANIWLRRRGSPILYKPLTGPASGSRFRTGRRYYTATGNWEGLDYECTLRLSESSLSWEWSVVIKNNSDSGCELDLIYVQDVGLKTIAAGMVNEYYVSQYLERRILEDTVLGAVLCCRQNMKESGGHPWLMMASMNRAAGAGTDGMQFYGRTFRETGVPEGLISESTGGEYAGESAVVSLQEAPFGLPKGASHRSAFAASFMHDHPDATSATDLERLPGLFGEFSGSAAVPKSGDLKKTEGNLFSDPEFMPADDLFETDLDILFGSERRHCEYHNYRLISFFCGENNYVMLRAKERLADRPHGHIMQAATGFKPDERVMSTTAFAFGVFNSHITQGNTNFNTLLSVCNSQFCLSPECGQRIFVEVDGRFLLLGVPSAFEIGLNSCRWIYSSGTRCFQVRTWTSVRTPQINTEFRVISGPATRILITHHFDDLNGWRVARGPTDGEYIAVPRSDSMIATKFPDARFRITVQTPGIRCTAGGDELLSKGGRSPGSNLFVLDISATKSFCLSFTGEVCGRGNTAVIENPGEQWTADSQEAQSEWNKLSLGLSIKGDQPDVAAIREIIPWYGMDALIHFLTPYGLEQFSGAAWGTRDVAQGPMELLLSMQKYKEAKQVLRIIFSSQDPDGGWPQWWMFDSYNEVRADSAHGDVIYWCLIALSNYIRVTGDFAFMDEKLPFHNSRKTSRRSEKSLADHVNRLVKKMTGSFVPGTSLVQFDGGDWNDSMQPVSRDLARRMVSAWTVEMSYQAVNEYAEVCRMRGEHVKAGKFNKLCEQIRSDFNTYLVKDGIVAGYGLAEDDGTITLLLHPGDTRTGIKYSILPMNRGIISRIFTAGQAEKHQELIEMHLKGPDGARLMDRPLRYSGGIEKLFRRAESSTFFGREIGLMYVHEHIRYAEALAITGKADAFLRALRQAIPVAYREIVPSGDIRQANCYFSSSDVIFMNRYEADRLYSEIMRGTLTLRMGWRIYSSGPGIFIGIVVSRLLGLRVKGGKVIIDPVMPRSLDGIQTSMKFMDRSLRLIYSVREGNFGPKRICINGTDVQFTEEESIYRRGGAVIPAGIFSALPQEQESRIEICM
ncbi:MAG: hypothetical protein WAV93_05280 [Bacteroidales bacterium]